MVPCSLQWCYRSGSIIVNNGPICDGVGAGAAVVARAQGLHIHAGNWNNVFSIVFEDQRYTHIITFYYY